MSSLEHTENQDKLNPGPGIMIHSNSNLGADISVDPSYIIDTVNNSQTNGSISGTNITGGQGIITSGYGDDVTITIDDHHISDKIDRAISEVNEVKPIFIMGLPVDYPNESLPDAQDKLSHRLDDYHVIVIKNKTSDYSAKIYSVTGITEVGIDEIKRYIDYKTK